MKKIILIEYLKKILLFLEESVEGAHIVNPQEVKNLFEYDEILSDHLIIDENTDRFEIGFSVERDVEMSLCVEYNKASFGIKTLSDNDLLLSATGPSLFKDIHLSACEDPNELNIWITLLEDLIEDLTGHKTALIEKVCIQMLEREEFWTRQRNSRVRYIKVSKIIGRSNTSDPMPSEFHIKLKILDERHDGLEKFYTWCKQEFQKLRNTPLLEPLLITCEVEDQDEMHLDFKIE